MYTTLSPCDLCSGACLLYGISNIVIGENQNFQGPEAYLKERGVTLTIEDREDCKELMRQFIETRKDIWYEDIGDE
ncbi:hypothetical protein CANCADRAFT_30991 [Tortispora caseinolytica NRRL Y-17796]|uniref:CMP/dCMP-type deaminase domain-containing protein n=1 Tax=Tortispora caseinolytica NRRL Y-17796 TaxID=767744 RepID=A0A1E4TDQ3_9ASCO|nr:hypothetical protein CANCADRAFT_30991 [Tortispora caseinolytica NRRL Y-17796]